MAKNGGTFAVGHAKAGGRKAGTPNTATKLGRETIMNIAEKLAAGIYDDFMDLEPKDRVRFWIELMKFVVPQRQETTVEGKSYNDELRRLSEMWDAGKGMEAGAEDG